MHSTYSKINSLIDLFLQIIIFLILPLKLSCIFSLLSSSISPFVNWRNYSFIKLISDQFRHFSLAAFSITQINSDFVSGNVPATVQAEYLS